ncbi:MAG: cobalt ECF transporter T component CbiQ [Bacillota bacterium]
MLKIDQYAYSNRLNRVHPAEKFGFALTTMIICLVFSAELTSLLVILLMAGLVVFRAGIPPLFYLKLMSVPMSFLVIGVLTVAFSYAGDDYSFLWGFKVGGYALGVTAPSLRSAGDLFLKSLSAVSCLYFLSLTTPMVEILTVLKKLRVPPLFVELMSLIYRFIFVLLETADKIYISQSSRWGYATLKTSYFSLGQLAANLFIKAYHRSQMLYTTMSARCYTGEIRVLDKQYDISGKNIVFIVVIEIFLVTLSLVDRGLGAKG